MMAGQTCPLLNVKTCVCEGAQKRGAIIQFCYNHLQNRREIYGVETIFVLHLETRMFDFKYCQHDERAKTHYSRPMKRSS